LETLWIDDAGISPDETAVAYCQTAIRASVGWFVLDQLGWEDVRNYEGAGPTGERSRRITATTTPAARTPGQSSTRSRKWSSSALLESYPSGILWNETG